MPRFTIIKESPFRHKSQILAFWEKYLPGTSPARLEWMENNPSGKAIWFFAKDINSGEIAGTISLFPKDLLFGGDHIKAAVLGDLMVLDKYRVFGPSISLIKTAMACREEHQFDFIYTIPNLKSKKLISRSGFSSLGKCYSLMNPHRFDFILKKYLNVLPATITDNSLKVLMRFLSRTTYMLENGKFEINNWQDPALELFFSKLKNAHLPAICGDYSRSYLDWRYKNNPEYKFKIVTYKCSDLNDINGLFVFSIDRHRLELYDIIALDTKSILSMIKYINSICEIEKCRGIYSLIYENNPFLPVLKKCCFFDTKDDIEVFVYPDIGNEKRDWYFSSSERNV